jgi:hypothetical protein
MERTTRDRKAELLKLTAPAGLREATAWFPEEELRMLRAKRPNVLLIGPTRVTDAAINLLLAERTGQKQRVWFWTPAQPIRMPEGTIVVIRDVGILAPHVQAGWMAALEQSLRERPLQVISTNSFSVFPLIVRGAFLDALYYRLNCVLVDFRGGGKT